MVVIREDVVRTSTIMAVTVLLLAAAPAAAQDCALETTDTGTVAAVLDAETLELTDGRQVRLINMLSPRRPLWLDAGREWPAAEAAERALSGLVTGAQITLAFDDERTDRYGRLLAHAYIGSGEERIWVQGEMVARGHARAWSRPPTRSCVGALIAGEILARADRAGLWRDRFYRVRDALKTEDIAKLKNTFAIVTGKVLRVAQVGARTFLNFEDDWRTDFTVIVPKRAARLFDGDGTELAGLEGKTIRVRGWVMSFNGPAIEATHPEQIELIED